MWSPLHHVSSKSLQNHPASRTPHPPPAAVPLLPLEKAIKSLALNASSFVFHKQLKYFKEEPYKVSFFVSLPQWGKGDRRRRWMRCQVLELTRYYKFNISKSNGAALNFFKATPFSFFHFFNYFLITVSRNALSSSAIFLVLSTPGWVPSPFGTPVAASESSQI